MDVRVLDDPAHACAELLCEAAAAGGHIALTGGSTPGGAYRSASEMDADWTGATLWWGDERCVPPDDERSNYRLAREALIDRLPEGGRPDVHRILGERGPHGGADDYERDLRDTLGEQTPRLDLVLLGLGSDAHAASLFPGRPTLRERDRLVVGEDEPGLDPFVPRITMTLPMLSGGRRIVFLVTGDGKAEAVERAFGPREPSEDVPASLVRPSDGELIVLLDEAAAARL